MLPSLKVVPCETEVADAAVLAGVHEPCRVLWDDTPVSLCAQRGMWFSVMRKHDLTRAV
jgi:hypothetical protein